MPTPPPLSHPDAWTVHLDGSALPNPGRMAIGVMLRDAQGVAHTVSRDLHRVGCNNEAEALAFIAALQVLAQHSARAAQCYSDSSILVEQINAPQPKPVVRLDAVYDAARSAWQALVQHGVVLQLHWVPRHRNAEADALARAALLVSA